MSEYQYPNDEYYLKRVEYIDMLFTDFVNRHITGFVQEVRYDFDSLIECITRVHQRERYYGIFHDMPKGVSEIKRIALYSYWFIKYRPFHLVFNFEIEKGREKYWKLRAKNFTERFCIYLFTVTMNKAYGIKRLPLTDGGINDLIYSIRHHSISKEAFIEVFEVVEDIVKQASDPMNRSISFMLDEEDLQPLTPIT